MSLIHYRTLGVLETTVAVPDPPPGIRWKKHSAMLIYLALSPNFTRTREHLVGLLWPERDETRARHSLRQAIRVVRQCCGDEAIIADATHVRLSQGIVELDVEKLDEIEATQDWDRLYEIVRGEFLEGFSVPHASDFDLWLESEKRRLRGRVLGLVIRAAESSLTVADLDNATRFANKALALDSESDAAVQIAMKALAQKGHKGAAIALFAQFQRKLDEIGATPEESTLALLERVTKERTWLAAGTSDEPPAEARERPPLVGRARHVSQLIEASRQCRTDSRASFVLVEGDPGIGKTRLAEEVTIHARLEGANIASVRAVASDLREPWSGVCGIATGGLLTAEGLAAADPEAISLFAAASPEWADRFSQLRQSTSNLSAGRALTSILSTVCEEQQVIVLVDDAQWLDEESLHSLETALRDLAELPLLVWFNTQVNHGRREINELQARVGREVGGTTVKLGTLSSDDVRRLAAWALPQFNDEQLDRVTRRVLVDSGGLPLLATELLQAISAGLELEEETSWPKPLQTLDQTLPGELPGNVIGAMRVRYGCLSPNARDVIEAAAVLGERSSTTLLAAGSGVRGKELDQALDELEWHRWLAAESRGYTFIARIVREVVIQDMVTPGKRQRILAAAGQP